jgi:hypothetical protein
MIDVDRGPAPDGCLGHPLSSEHRAVLHARFLSKCYLTEQPIHASDFDVDHRHPKSDGGPDAWDNLCPTAPKANSHRARKLPPGGYLSPGEGVESRLRQQLQIDAQDVRCVFAPVAAEDVPAKNTAAELRRLHHEIDEDPIGWSRDLRATIHRHYTLLLEMVTAHLQDPADPLIEETLRTLLSRRAPFTALLRSKVPGLQRLFD